MIITKNIQTMETLNKMVQNAFPNKNIVKTSEPKEGMFNAVYDISLDDGTETILKIAPARKEGLMFYEHHIMDAEVMAMKLVKEKTNVPVAELFLYDTSCEICNSPYFFMEKIEGESYSSQESGFTEEQKKQIDMETGQIEKQLCALHGEKFGLLGEPETWTDTWFETFTYLIAGVVKDAKRVNVSIGISEEALFQKLEQDKTLFDEVAKPSFVHWDMWQGNIFIKDGHVCGVIDWERALWGDTFMDERFRGHRNIQPLLDGMGLQNLSSSQIRRNIWYDIYLYLIMVTEGVYRNYEDDSQYQWALPELKKAFGKL